MPQPEIRLSTRDKNLKKQLQLSPTELLMDDIHDQSDTNYAELRTAIAEQKNPKLKQILIAEHDRLLENRDRVLKVVSDLMPVESPDVNTAPKQESTSPSVIDQVTEFLSNMWSKK